MSIMFNYNEKNEDAIIEIANCIDMNTAIVCIGTDRSTGDCLGPLVGTLLEEYGIGLKVYGTLDEPIHALNLSERLNGIKRKYGENILPIDACLGPNKKLNKIIFEHEPLKPGSGVGKKLENIGDKRFIFVSGNYEDNERFSTINTTRLNKVYLAAKNMAAMIVEAYELVKEIETVQLVACD